jgi:hypothetical protein
VLVENAVKLLARVTTIPPQRNAAGQYWCVVGGHFLMLEECHQLTARGVAPGVRRVLVRLPQDVHWRRIFCGVREAVRAVLGVRRDALLPDGRSVTAFVRREGLRLNPVASFVVRQDISRPFQLLREGFVGWRYESADGQAMGMAGADIGPLYDWLLERGLPEWHPGATLAEALEVGRPEE